MENKLKILIATGIYPPQIGGPAQYAYHLENIWKKEGYEVCVKYFSFENKLPTIIRHLFFLVKVAPVFLKSDFIIVLDTLSVALPTTILSILFNKKIVIRTGGDFLWELYLDRTKKKVLFRDFYQTEISNFSIKENIIFKITKWILSKSHKIIFSTNWQRSIWEKPYNLDLSKTVIVENYYGHVAEKNSPYKDKVFLGASRRTFFKNIDSLKGIFEDDQIKKNARLDINISSNVDFIDRLKESYATILISLGDISPNMILDSISAGKPFIVTKEIGIYERIKDVAIFVNPLDEDDVKQKILWLCDADNYKKQVENIKKFSFTHTWGEISCEILATKS